MNTSTTLKWLPGNARERRILALGLLAVLIALAIAAITVPAIMLHRHYDDNLSRMTRQLRSQSAFNSMRPELSKALESLKAKDARKYYLRGTTAALATAELQDQVKLLIEANGGRVLSVQGIAHRDDGGYRVVAATFQLNVSNVNLRRVLHALETKEPYLFVDNLTVRAQVPPGYRPPPGSAEPDLYAQMDVSGVAIIAGDGAPAQGAASRPSAGGKS